MPEGKYVIVKHETFEELLRDLSGSLTPTVGDALNKFCGAIIEDGVVIRRQDVFAPPALDAYANSIMTTVLMMGEHVALDEAQRLKGIADFFHEQAALAWQTDRKIPD